MFPGLTDEEQATVVEAVRASVLARAADRLPGSPDR